MALADDMRVVVTGIGAVSAWGWGVEPLRHGLRGGTTGIKKPRTFDTTGHRTHVAGEVPEAPEDLQKRFPSWRGLSLADRTTISLPR